MASQTGEPDSMQPLSWDHRHHLRSEPRPHYQITALIVRSLGLDFRGKRFRCNDGIGWNKVSYKKDFAQETNAGDFNMPDWNGDHASPTKDAECMHIYQTICLVCLPSLLNVRKLVHDCIDCSIVSGNMSRMRKELDSEDCYSYRTASYHLFLALQAITY